MLGHYGLSNSSAIQGSNSLNQGSGRTNGCQLVASSFFIVLLMVLSHCHDDCVYSVTLSGIVVVVILQSFKVFLLSGTDTLSSFRSSLSFQKFGFDFL